MRDAETSEPEMPRSGFLYLFAGFTSAVLTYTPPSVGITAFLTFLPSIIAVSLYTAFRKTCTRQPSDGRFCACYTGTSPASAEFTMLALLAPVGLSIFMTRLAVAVGFSAALDGTIKKLDAQSRRQLATTFSVLQLHTLAKR